MTQPSDIITTGTDNFRITLMGGETEAVRKQAVDMGLTHVLKSGRFPMPLTTSSMVWYKKKQHKGKSYKYILTAHTRTGKWVMTAAVINTQRGGLVELRAFGPQEVECRQTMVPSSEVPQQVRELSFLFFDVTDPSPIEARLSILFDS